jgi:hypothetical protein
VTKVFTVGGKSRQIEWNLLSGTAPATVLMALLNCHRLKGLDPQHHGKIAKAGQYNAKLDPGH